MDRINIDACVETLKLYGRAKQNQFWNAEGEGNPSTPCCPLSAAHVIKKKGLPCFFPTSDYDINALDEFSDELEMPVNYCEGVACGYDSYPNDKQKYSYFNQTDKNYLAGLDDGFEVARQLFENRENIG